MSVAVPDTGVDERVIADFQAWLDDQPDVPCESVHPFETGADPHTDGFPCSGKAEWRLTHLCGHSVHLCQPRYNFHHVPNGEDRMVVCRCGVRNPRFTLSWFRI